MVILLAVSSPRGLAQTADTGIGYLVPIIYTLLLEEGSGQCSKQISTDTETTAALSTDCSVEELAEQYFTRFYTFETAEVAEILIAVTPNQASANVPYVVLRQGADPDGEELYFADPSADGSSWQISADLAVGEFTIEVSSVSQQVLDTFSLSVARVVR